MSHHLAVSGLVTPTGLYARCADGWRKLEPTRTPIVAQLTPLGVAVRQACDAILRGDVEPCACGKFACDCDEWHEIMFTDPTDPDPHGDLRALQAMELPY